MGAAADIAALGSWLELSSQPYAAPMGGFVARGPFGQLFRLDLDTAAPADVPTKIARGCLPLFSPAAPVGTRYSYPNDQPPAIVRALSLLWKAVQANTAPDLGFPPGIAVVGLATAAQTLRQACTAAAIDPLADRGLIGLALWAFPAHDQARLNARLPVI